MTLGKKKLKSFVKVNIIYKENEFYLALPISYHQYYNNMTIKNYIELEKIRTYIDKL